MSKQFNWSKQIFGLLKCSKCELILTVYWLNTANQREGIARKMPKCTGSTQEADARFTKLRAWLGEYNRQNRGKPKVHTYILANRHVFCTACQVFTADVPRHSNHVLCKAACGELGMPWGRLCRQVRESGLTRDQVTNHILAGNEVAGATVTELPRHSRGSRRGD